MNNTTNSHGKANPGEQIKTFCTLFEADDIIEVRRLPSKRKSWHLAGTLHEQAHALAADNERGENIHPGCNPRTRDGGSKASDVELARFLWCDCDATTPADAILAAKSARMPTATLVTNTGHGAHLFWKLSEPLPVGEWKKCQRDLARTVGSDRSVCDAARLTRLPSFTNHKSPTADCYIVKHHPEAVYDLSDLREIIKPATAMVTSDPAPLTVYQTPEAGGDVERAMSYLAKTPGAVQGENGDNHTFRVACSMRDFGLSEAKTLAVMAGWNLKCDPPWCDDDLRSKVEHAYQYAKREPGNRLPTDTVEDDAPLWRTAIELAKTPAYTRGMRAVGTGFRSLDDALGGGFRPGCVYVLAGRTGSAKSTLALNVVRTMALDGASVLLLKLEETPVEALWKIHAASAKVPVKIMLDGEITRSEALVDGWKLIADLPIRYSDTCDLPGVQRTCREHVKQGGQMVVIDQSSMVGVPEAISAYERATTLSNTLRMLAVHLHVPILLVCQVNRNAAINKKRGDLDVNDIRDSGAFENDAACVMMIDRAEDPPSLRSDQPMTLTMKIVKNRYGRVSDDELLFSWRPWWGRVEEF